MKQPLKLIWNAFLLVLLIGLFNFGAQAQEIQQIKITSDWGGLGPSGHSELVIERKSDGYRAKGKRVDKKLVGDLLDAVNSPPMSPELANLGITQDWLNTNADSALQHYASHRFETAAENQRALFATAFRDKALIEKLLPNIIGGWWTDDFPKFEMEIVTTDDRTIKVSSEEQPSLMLPWMIVKDGEIYRTYNANISKSIANILPSKFTNRQRLSEKALVNEVAEEVMREIETEWNRLDSENKIGNELVTLQEKYLLKKTAISYLSSIDIGVTASRRKKDEPSFPSWNAELQRKDLPSNVVIGVSIPFKKGKLTTFDLFAKRIDAFVELTLSVPWLKDHIYSHPDNKYEIRFVEDRSFSDKGEESFWESMKDGGKESQARVLAGVMSQCAFLQIEEKGIWSRWLVLPDKRMVLWDFTGPTSLKWNASEFETWIRYGSPYWHGSFAVISADGSIESR